MNMEWLYTEAMLLFFSAKSLFFMVCQLLIIIPKKRGNGTESKSDKKIRDERYRFRGSAGRGDHYEE